MENIDSEIERNRENFILHNIVRLREMIRYLPNEKLTLFKEIPFLIHANSAGFPGYVKSTDATFGIWNFENSGFAREISDRYPAARELLMRPCSDPAVQAIYHIGSLGTFTQSAKSDFDFWVVVERSGFDNERLNALHEKLALITTYSRKTFSQEVTFFVHYAQNLRENIFNNPDDEDSVTVPALLLKEEFYRTFIMVAGKIPLWAIEPLDLDPQKREAWRERALQYGGFIDLGTFDSMPVEEIQRGILWQICKAPYDPVKSVIKASITASYNVKEKKEHSGDSIEGKDLESNNRERTEHNDDIKSDGQSRKKKLPILLCDRVKQRFGESIIDDYAADPYIIAFERVLEFYTELGDMRALSQIKAAIFFRLCGFPLVSLPPRESPKRRILERYIRRWQLSSTRLKKLLEYQKWSEREKSLFDQTMVERLSSLYKLSVENRDEQVSTSSVSDRREMELRILKNRVNKITLKREGVLPTCSTYLRLKPHIQLTLVAKKGGLKSEERGTQGSLSCEWLLFSQVEDDLKKKSHTLICSTGYFFRTVGWSMYNHIYIRGTTRLEMRAPFRLYTSFEKEVDCDDIYLALQPWMPLSDEPFLSEPCWEKIVVLMVIEDADEPNSSAENSEADDVEEPNSSAENSEADMVQSEPQTIRRPKQAEFLIRNSWGEIFFEVVNLEQIDHLEERCYKTAMKILEYHGKESHYDIFQIASKPVLKLIQKIKTSVEESSASKNSSDTTTIRRRPYLDTI